MDKWLSVDLCWTGANTPPPPLVSANCGYLRVWDDHQLSHWSSQVIYCTLIGHNVKRPVSINTSLFSFSDRPSVWVLRNVIFFLIAIAT